jgi:hypothetical protein
MGLNVGYLPGLGIKGAKVDKFLRDDEIYFNYIENLPKLRFTNQEIVYNFPSFVGSVNLARLFSLHEMYNLVKKLSGDIADVGTYMGASMFTFAKLVKLFEPYSNTRVHGFDWFQGQKPGVKDDITQKGQYITDKDRLDKLIDWQGLSGIVNLHDLDLTTELPKFIDCRPWLRFKVIFLDCGITEVMEATLTNFWPLLTPGGILILDHYNHSSSPQESKIIEKYTGSAILRQIEYSRSPTAFLQKL